MREMLRDFRGRFRCLRTGAGRGVYIYLWRYLSVMLLYVRLYRGNYVRRYGGTQSHLNSRNCPINKLIDRICMGNLKCIMKPVLSSGAESRYSPKLVQKEAVLKTRFMRTEVHTNTHYFVSKLSYNTQEMPPNNIFASERISERGCAQLRLCPSPWHLALGTWLLASGLEAAAFGGEAHFLSSTPLFFYDFFFPLLSPADPSPLS